MEKWYSRFRRGDVWFLHLDSERGDGIPNSSVQKKSRPYLIVSCEECNLSSPVLNVVPITTRNSDHLPMHVYFRYEDGTESARNQLVLCEQITTVSVQVFEHPKSYFMYSFNLEFMNKVDEALTRQLGLKPRLADMHVLERIVHELAETELAKIEAAKKKDSSVRMEKIAEYLAKQFNLNLTTADLLNGTEYREPELKYADKEEVKQMRATAKARRTTPIKPEVIAEQKTVIETPRKKNQKWSTESKKQFLNDYKTMTLSEMADKYGIKKSSVSTNVCLFRKDLKDAEFRTTV